MRRPSRAVVKTSMGQTSSQNAPPTACPIQHRPTACPIDRDDINPLNQIPSLPQSPAPLQSVHLPTSRTLSSIPRDESARWEYPSPQQFYNALVRKGWHTPEEHVPTMVEIHNFLNEQAWLEVLKWEKRQNGHVQFTLYLIVIQLIKPQFRQRSARTVYRSPRSNLAKGPFLPICRMAASISLQVRRSFVLQTPPSPLQNPSNEPPFDRHDWVVRRSETGEEIRYVIDYYSAPPEPDGSPVFSLDVRPALDSLQSVKTRIVAATEDVWAAFRENKNNTGVERD
jgi:hypothetical protein